MTLGAHSARLPAKDKSYSGLSTKHLRELPILLSKA